METLELWLRRLIHDKLTDAHGHSYFDHEFGGNHIFRAEVRRNATTRMREQPNRYSRPIDALLLDDLVATLCKEDLYRLYFRDALIGAFPEGREEARTFLTRLVNIRNPLSHANPISDHQALRVLCYSKDVIQSITDHYEVLGMGREFNAPTIVAFRDSEGHAEQIVATRARCDFSETVFRPGDRLRAEVDVDDTFPADSYTVKWVVANISAGESEIGNSFELLLTPRHVGEIFTICATLTSNKDWHRHSNFDATLAITYKVLTPL
ncbi:MAG: hypothetical protein AAFX95_20890 [Cyanobacteria bacterium J06639_16]